MLYGITYTKNEFNLFSVLEAMFGMIMIISFILMVVTFIAQWKVYKKAGKPGWAVLVPFYNVIVLLEIAELPIWYLVLYFIPFANIYVAFKVPIEVAHKFNKSTAFGVGLALFGFIFYMILGFGDSTYGNNSQNYESTQPINPTYPNSQMHQSSIPTQPIQQPIPIPNSSVQQGQPLTMPKTQPMPDSTSVMGGPTIPKSENTNNNPWSN